MPIRAVYSPHYLNLLNYLPLNYHGTWMADNVSGTARDDKIWGGYGNDTVHGNAGNDYIDGEHGDDALYGGAGNDVLNGNEGNDLLSGGDGDDHLLGDDNFGWQGNDTVFGGNGNDNIFGMGGNDLLFGDAGNDSIGGGDGNDTILGGTGRDYLRGEDGSDTFMFSVGDSPVGTGTADHITDFNPFLGGDRIEVNDYVMSHSTIALSGRFGSIEAAAGLASTLQWFAYGDAGSAFIADQATGNAYLLLDQNGDRHFETGVVLDGLGNMNTGFFASYHETVFS